MRAASGTEESGVCLSPSYISRAHWRGLRKGATPVSTRASRTGPSTIVKGRGSEPRLADGIELVEASAGRARRSGRWWAGRRRGRWPGCGLPRRSGCAAGDRRSRRGTADGSRGRPGKTGRFTPDRLDGLAHGRRVVRLDGGRDHREASVQPGAASWPPPAPTGTTGPTATRPTRRPPRPPCYRARRARPARTSPGRSAAAGGPRRRWPRSRPPAPTTGRTAARPTPARAASVTSIIRPVIGSTRRLG